METRLKADKPWILINSLRIRGKISMVASGAENEHTCMKFYISWETGNIDKFDS